MNRFTRLLNRTVQTTVTHRLMRVLSAGLAIGCVLAVASPAGAKSDTNVALLPVTTVMADGSEMTARALSPGEVRARGLAPPGADIDVAAPSFVSDGAKMGKPIQRPKKAGASVQSTVCWNLSYRFGSNPPGTYTDLYTMHEVFYCATNTWISSTSKSCWQFDGGYPTYEVLGCSQSEAYGVGWSQWHVRTVGNVCWNWIPGYGCLSNTVQVRKLGYNGFGQYWIIESIG